MNRRLVVAAITAPILGIATLAIAASLVAAAASEVSLQETVDGTPLAFGFLLLFGLPGAYLLEAIIGIPGYLWLRRSTPIQLLPVCVLAGVGGALAFAISWQVFWASGSVLGFAQSLVLGLPGGIVAGAWFWFVALKQPSARGVA